MTCLFNFSILSQSTNIKKACGIMFQANSIVNTWSVEIIMTLLTVDPEALKSCSVMLCEFEITLSLTQEPRHI